MTRSRKKKLIKTALQLKLIGTFMALACVASLFQVFLLNRSLLRLARDLPSELKGGEQALLNQLPGVLTTNLLMSLGVLVPLMLLIGIAVTHRIAGPLYNFENHLNAIARGEDRGRCSIRKGDELQELCSSINDAVAALQSQVRAAATQAADEGSHAEAGNDRPDRAAA